MHWSFMHQVSGSILARVRFSLPDFLSWKKKVSDIADSATIAHALEQLACGLDARMIDLELQQHNLSVWLHSLRSLRHDRWRSELAEQFGC